MITGTATSRETGEVYGFDLEQQTRTDYAEFMNPATRYERVYHQVNLYANGKRVKFSFVDNSTDAVAIMKAVNEMIKWNEMPAHVSASMNNRFD